LIGFLSQYENRYSAKFAIIVTAAEDVVIFLLSF